jgi:hypothetical protein
MDAKSDSVSFLGLTEAADRLGISRLKLREAIAKAVVPARRDNLGEWRVDLTGIADLSRQIKEVEIDPEVLMTLLFDEVEALTAERDSAIVDRDRLGTIAGRALDAAEAQSKALGGPTERAFGLLDRTVAALETAKAEIAAKNDHIASQAKHLDRLFSLSEQAVASVAPRRRANWLARLLGLSGPVKDS